jgi:hypothetical protein
LAISPDLPALTQAPNQGLVGFVGAYYLPQEDLTAEPVFQDGAIVGNLALATGAGWRALPLTQHTLKLDEQSKVDRTGTRYQVRVSAQRPQPDPLVLAVLASLDRRKLLLLLIEANGGRRLVGSSEEYVQLQAGTEGQHPGTRAGVELRFEGETTRRAPYYAGAVPVLSGGGLPTPLPGAGYVRLFNRRGQLLATVPAGHDIIITSGFRFSFLIK